MLIYLNRVQRYNKPSGEQNNFHYFLSRRCVMSIGCDERSFSSSEECDSVAYPSTFWDAVTKGTTNRAENKIISIIFYPADA